MTEVLIPPWVFPSSETVASLDDQTVGFEPQFGRGPGQVQLWADPRWQFKREYQSIRGVDRSAVRSALSLLRGRANILRVAMHQPVRGSFNAAEIFLNNTFSQNSVSWGFQSQAQLSFNEQVLRATRVSNDGSNSNLTTPNQQVTLSGNRLPYAIRFFVRQGRGYNNGLIINELVNADGLATGTSSFVDSTNWDSVNGVGGFGLLTAVRVPAATGNYKFGVGGDLNLANELPGNYYDILWSSCARCALVDGSGNLLTWSDDFSNAAWTKTRCSITTSSVERPDGSSVAQNLVEDASASTTHVVSQNATVSSTAQDICYSILVAKDTRGFIRLEMAENTGNTTVVCDYNLTFGSAGSVSVTGNWSHGQAFVRPYGGAWYQIGFIARKTNAATSLTCRAYLASTLGGISYSGDGASKIQVFRATCWPSSVPARPVFSGSVTTAAQSQSGSGIYTKGWGITATAGLLLTDDFIEVNGELKQLTASLDIDDPGFGYLQFRPGLAGAAQDNDAIIVYPAFGRFKLMNSYTYDNQFGLYVDAPLELTETYG